MSGHEVFIYSDYLWNELPSLGNNLETNQLENEVETNLLCPVVHACLTPPPLTIAGDWVDSWILQEDSGDGCKTPALVCVLCRWSLVHHICLAPERFSPLVAQTGTNLILSDLSIALFVYVRARGIVVEISLNNVSLWLMCSLIFGHVSSHRKDSAPSWHKLGRICCLMTNKEMMNRINIRSPLGDFEASSGAIWWMVLATPPLLAIGWIVCRFVSMGAQLEGFIKPYSHELDPVST